MTVRQAKGNVGQATSRVNTKFFTQAANQFEDLQAGCSHCANRHYQRVNHNILRLDAVICCPFDDFLRNSETDIRVLRNAGFVVRNGNDRNIVFLDKRQNGFELFFFACYRVYKRAAFGNLQTCFNG